MTLFDLDIAAATEVYRRMQAEGREQDRARFDALFERAQPYLDSNFKDQFARCTNDRFFELRLVTTLLDHGFEIDLAQEGRPDIGTRLPDGRKLWVEAITLSWGRPDNPDRPAPSAEGLRPAPIREALLRHTAALKEKRDKFRTYREKGVVAPEDCCVVAMSSGGLHPHVDGVGLPRVVSAVLPFGDEMVTIDRASGEVLEVSHEHRPEIRNVRDAPVATTAFEDPEAYGQISAVLHDSAFISTWPGDLQGSRWVTVHNPTAVACLPEGQFSWGRRFRLVEREQQPTLVEEGPGSAQ